MIRILHVIRKMDCGGAETLLMNLYRNIDRSQVQFDFMVHSREPGFYDEEIRKLGGKLIYAPAFKVVNIVHYIRFWNTFFKNNNTHRIIHGHIHSCAAIYLAIAKKHKRITLAHSHATKSVSHDIRSLLFTMFSYPIRFIADYFLACSEQAGIDRFGAKVIQSPKFHILKNGIDTEKYRFDSDLRKKIRNELRINEKCLVLGHVGRFSYEKNHRFILSVFAQLHKIVPNSELWLFGKGPLIEEIKQLSYELQLTNSVRFMGVSNIVNEYLQGMDVFIFPSLFEGLGISVIEAQTSGLPCIVSEAIVPEADIHAGLMEKMSLNDSPENWATTVIECSQKERVDTSDYAERAGYDINKISKSLADYYASIIKEN